MRRSLERLLAGSKRRLVVADPVQAPCRHPGEGALKVERAGRDLAGPVLGAEAVDVAEAAVPLPAPLDKVRWGESAPACWHGEMAGRAAVANKCRPLQWRP